MIQPKRHSSSRTTSAPRRAKRRVEPVDPRQNILEAAERLCGEFGLEAVSVRDIAAAANVNLSAVNYYYGSRINLLVTILRIRGAEIEQARNELLDKAAQADPLDLREIVRAMLTPLARWRTPGSNRQAALQFLSRALTAATPELKSQIDVGVAQFRRIIDLLQRVLPNVSREELCWRFHFMMSIEHMNVWDAERLQILSEGICRTEDGKESLERAVDFAVAGFLAAPYRRPGG
jgi:AcrR family transcriptional regulator